MEIREFARQVLCSDDLETKLKAPPATLTDLDRGNSERLAEPVRPGNLQFAPRRAAPTMPAPGALVVEKKRAIAHHIMANHELQALEVMAWVLLAFPDAPADFRTGLVTIMRDEQQHTRMHSHRAERMGCPFGSLPVNCYIWKKAMSFTGVLDYLAGLPLVFEAANLDHSLEFAKAFEQAGDERSAAILRKIHADEIEHVRFGYHWLNHLKPAGLTSWEAFEQHLHWPLRATKARGNQFQRRARLEAGFDTDFLTRIESASE